MGNNLSVWGVSAQQIDLYYIFVLLGFVVMLVRYRKQFFPLYIVLIFFYGLIGYIGKNALDIYKILLLIISIYWVFRTQSNIFLNKYKFLTFAFILFSCSFLFSAFVNGDYFLITFSQYSKYIVMFSFFLILLRKRENMYFNLKLEKVLFELLIIQIVLSVIKMFIMGPAESLVGSISSQGGAVATSLPILGIMFLWLKRRGVFINKDWYFIFGMIFIGFMGAKRAIWFIAPIFIALLIFYVPRKRMSPKLALVFFLLLPALYYLGVRLSPSLNIDHKIWGRFNLSYSLDFARDYSFGKEDSYGERKSGQGRGGATLLIYDNIISGNISKEDWTGYGLRYMYATNYEEFAELGFDITHKGSATGLFQTLVSNGYLGIITFLLFSVSLVFFTKNKRLRNVLLLLLLWEYLFYTGVIMREYALSILFIYLILRSGYYSLRSPVNSLIFPQKRYFRGPNQTMEIGDLSYK